MDYKYLLLLLLSPLLLTGCATINPLSIPDEEWAQMSSEQRLSARQSQAALTEAWLESNRQQRLIQAQRAAQQAALKQQAIEQRYQQARYGDIVQCVLDSTRVRNSKKWRNVQTKEFEIFRGEISTFHLRDNKGRTRKTLNAALSNRGRLELCIQPGTRHCANFTYSRHQLAHGIQTPVHMGEKLHGQLHCELEPIRHRRHSHE